MSESTLPGVGATVLYVTTRPHPGGGVALARIAAIVTALGEDGTIDVTAFPPREAPCCFSQVSRFEGTPRGGWEPCPAAEARD